VRNIVTNWSGHSLSAILVGAALGVGAGAYILSGQSGALQAQYSDARLCTGCHAEIAKTYRQTGMSRSFYRPDAGHDVEDYTRNNSLYHEPSRTYYSMTRREGRYFQRRWQIGFDGKESNVEELRVDFVMGSGNHARAYLHRTPRGRLIELPLGWYAQKGGYWEMSPGYDTPAPATRRPISYGCMFCHNAYPPIPRGKDEPDSEPVFGEDLPAGIDCQRCHGPGSLHIQAAQLPGARSEALRKTIVNPARLSAEGQMEVCMQCHLETTSTLLPGFLRRFGRGPFSYIAGEPLSAFELIFDHAPGSGREDKFEIAGAAYRLRKSRCFLQSKGTLTCETCHDPHHIPRGGEAVKHYDEVCLKCHAAAVATQARHPASANCAGCHMPKRKTDDAVHVVMTDHRIQRSHDGDLHTELRERFPSRGEPYEGRVVPYYPPSLGNGGEEALYLAVAQVANRSNLRPGIAELSAQVERQRPREPAFYMALGSAWKAAGDAGRAAAAFEQAVRLKPDSDGALRSLGLAWKDAGQLARSADALNRAVRIAPDDAKSWYALGILDAGQGRLTDAIAKARKAIALDPDLAETYNGMGSFQASAGQFDLAEAAFRDALRVDPYDATVHGSLARLFFRKGDFPQAAFHFERALHVRNDSAQDWYDYGLTLVRQGRFEKAEDAVRRSVGADPRLALAHELLAGLLARQKQMTEARKEYEEAVRLQPDFARAQLDLGALLAAEGDVAGALPHLREAARSADPALAQQALRVLRQLGQ
jgi:tetratricopeptide (TPR) repeat protein